MTLSILKILTCCLESDGQLMFLPPASRIRLHTLASCCSRAVLLLSASYSLLGDIAPGFAPYLTALYRYARTLLVFLPTPPLPGVGQ